jgi:hypothetical protein
MVATCPTCEQQLSGNNSIAHPWICKCGKWSPIYPFKGQYEIKDQQLFGISE